MLKSYLSKFSLAILLVAMYVGAFAQNLTITAPASIAGTYVSPQASFGAWLNGESGDLVLADDGTGVSNGCTITNDMTGKIALVDRGTCGFAVKAANAQAAGAIAMVVCNNLAAFPDSVIVMGGFDCSVDIPAVMVSVNVCNTIKMELANGTVSAVLAANYPGDGNDIAAEILLPGAGVYTAPTLVGTSYFTDSDSAIYYKIVAPSDGVMNVNTCASGIDTRVTVFQGCRGTAGALTVIDQNDDACGSVGAGGDPYSSSLDVIVYAGEEYIISFDDPYDPSGFDFEVSFSSLPDVDVTFQVDMQDQIVAPDGVRISINGGAEIPLTDGGNGIWSYTASLQAGSTYDYVFLNGAGNAEDNPELVDCRSVSPGLDGEVTSLVCFNSCSACPPDAVCPLWVDEDFENYTLGPISDQSDVWDTWTQPTNAGENASVSDEQAKSGVHSLKISAAAPADDQLLLLGNRTSGHYILKWSMYVPTGSAAYYNMQKNQDTPGVGDAFANEVTFNADGTGSYAVGTTPIAFTYPHDKWFTVIHDIDLDNNINTVTYDGQLIAQHPANWQATTETGITQFGAIDFYGNTGVLYYIDDVSMKQVEACPADAIICDAFDGYDPGLIGPQSPWWTGWSQVDGGADDGEVTSAQYLSCEQALKVSEDNTDDIILLLGNRTTGSYSLSWNMYVPTGSLAYYNIQKDTDKLPNNATTADYAMEVYFNAAGAGAVSAGGANSSTFTYPYDTWFNVEHKIDLDNNTASLWIDGVKIQDWLPSWDYLTQTAGGVIQLGGVDFYGAPGVLYYVDDVMFTGQEPTVLPDIPVTFQVDMTWEKEQGNTVSTSTVKIAGNFSTVGASIPDWDPTASPTFTHIGNDVYEVTILFPATSAGEVLQYKFLNTPDSWGACGEEQECLPSDATCPNAGAPDYNRIFTIPDAAATTACFTYNTCEACGTVNSTREIVEVPMTIAPNPFSSKAVVTFNSPVENAQARLTSLTGQLVRSYRVEGTQLTINKGDLLPGIYFFNVVTENGVSAAEKLVVE